MTDDHRIMVDLADEAFWWQNTEPYRAHLYKRAYRHIEGLQAMIDELDPDRLREDRDERNRLWKALRYYADFHEDPNDGPWGIHSDDYGAVARAALRGEDYDR